MRSICQCCLLIMILVLGVSLSSVAVDTSTTANPLDLGTDIQISGRSDRLRNPQCIKCHDLVTRPEGRENAAHPDVKMNHGEMNKNCFNCHDSLKINSLVLGGSMEKIPLESSYRLCSQCHGNILKDWKSGIHGLQTGQWNGMKQRKTCTVCHDPHDPAFKPLKPMPPPVKPHGQ